MYFPQKKKKNIGGIYKCGCQKRPNSRGGGCKLPDENAKFIWINIHFMHNKMANNVTIQ